MVTRIVNVQIGLYLQIQHSAPGDTFNIHFQQSLLFRIHQSKSPFSFGVAEKKLVIIFAYFIAFEVMALISFTLSQRNASQLTQEIVKYFTCELNGHDPSNPCDRTAFERLQHPTVGIFSNMLLLLTPLVNIVYVVDFQFLQSKMSSKKGNVIERQRSENISASNAATKVSTIQLVVDGMPSNTINA